MSDISRDDNRWIPGSYLAAADLPELRPLTEAVGHELVVEQFVAERKLKYFAVDEILYDVVTVTVSDWPTVDADGRLWFRTGDGVFEVDSEYDDGITVEHFDLELLQRVVDSHRVAGAGGITALIPFELAARPITIGDVFGAVLEESSAGAIIAEAEGEPAIDALVFHSPHDGLLRPFAETRRLGVLPRLIDVTWDAAETITAAYFAAHAPVLTPEDASVDESLLAIAEQELFGGVASTDNDPPDR